MNRKWLLILIAVIIFLVYSGSIRFSILPRLMNIGYSVNTETYDFTGGFEGWQYKFIRPEVEGYLNRYEYYPPTLVGDEIEFRVYIYQSLYFGWYKAQVALFRPFNKELYDGKVYLTCRCREGDRKQTLRVAAAAFNRDGTVLKMTNYFYPGDSIELDLNDLDKYYAIGVIVMAHGTQGYYMQTIKFYVDEIKLTYKVDVSKVYLTVSMKREGEFYVSPIDKIEVPVRIVDARGLPIPFLSVDISIDVNNYRVSKTVLTNADGWATFTDEPDPNEVAPGEGTIKVSLTHLGKYHEQLFKLKLKDVVKVEVKGEDIQYYNEPMQLTMSFTNYKGENIDPERIILTAKLEETGEEVFSSIEKETAGIYVWKAQIEREGRILIDVKGEKYGYVCLLYTSPSPRDRQKSRMPSSA